MPAQEVEKTGPDGAGIPAGQCPRPPCRPRPLAGTAALLPRPPRHWALAPLGPCSPEEARGAGAGAVAAGPESTEQPPPCGSSCLLPPLPAPPAASATPPPGARPPLGQSPSASPASALERAPSSTFWESRAAPAPRPRRVQGAEGGLRPPSLVRSDAELGLLAVCPPCLGRGRGRLWTRSACLRPP